MCFLKRGGLQFSLGNNLDNASIRNIESSQDNYGLEVEEEQLALWTFIVLWRHLGNPCGPNTAFRDRRAANGSNYKGAGLLRRSSKNALWTDADVRFDPAVLPPDHAAPVYYEGRGTFDWDQSSRWIESDADR